MAIAGNSSEVITRLSPSILQAKEPCHYHFHPLVLLLPLRVMTRSSWRTRSRSSVPQLMIGCLRCAPTAKHEDYVFAVVTSGYQGTDALPIYSYMCCKKFGTSVIRISLKTHLLTLGFMLPQTKLLCCSQRQFFLAISVHIQCSSSVRFKDNH